MVIHDVSIGLEMIAAFLTVLYIGKLLVERMVALSEEDSGHRVHHVTKRSLIRQQVCKRTCAA